MFHTWTAQMILATVHRGIQSRQAADAGLFVEPLSTVTVRNPTGNFLGATQDFGQNSADTSKEYLDGALACISVYF